MKPLNPQVSASVPPYRQLAGRLRELIQTGELAPGERVPSIPELSRTMKVSRQTAHRALVVLSEEGLTTTQVGRGTFVRRPRPSTERWATQRYQWEKERALIADDGERGKIGTSEYETGLTFNDFAFSANFSQVEAPPDLAEALHVEPGTLLLKRDCQTTLQATGLLTGYSTSYVPHALFAQNPDLLDSSKEPWPGGTQHQLRTIGVEVARIDDIVTARPATEHDMHTLELVAGSAVIDIRKITTSTTDQVVEVADITLPAHNIRLRYTTNLAPWEH